MSKPPIKNIELCTALQELDRESFVSIVKFLSLQSLTYTIAKENNTTIKAASKAVGRTTAETLYELKNEDVENLVQLVTKADNELYQKFTKNCHE